jgi:aspartate/methionine/tyrosine aminotransferase
MTATEYPSAHLGRQKQISRAGWQVLESWLPEQDGRFDVGPSAATSIAFVRFHLPGSSVELAERIRQMASVLVAPGVYLGAEQHLCITLGYEPERVRAALDRISSVVADLPTV